MAQIAEDLFLLLLDNASAQPSLDRPRRDRALTAAVLLDLAHACRIRPATTGDTLEEGKLMVLAGGGPLDPIGEPALRLLQRRPLRPTTAMAKLRKHTQARVVERLERAGEIAPVCLQSRRFNHQPDSWPLTSRHRVGQARAALVSALFYREPPTPPTAGIITLLHGLDGLGALLSLNDRGWRWVHARAGEIALGSWVDEAPGGLAETNLAVTASVLRPALRHD